MSEHKGNISVQVSLNCLSESKFTAHDLIMTVSSAGEAQNESSTCTLHECIIGTIILSVSFFVRQPCIFIVILSVFASGLAFRLKT